MSPAQPIMSCDENRNINSNTRDRSLSDAVNLYGDDPRLPEAVHLPRSASYTYFPQTKDLIIEDIIGVKGSFSEDDLVETSTSNADGESYASSGGTSPESEPTTPSEHARAERHDPQQAPKITIANFLLPSQRGHSGLEYTRTEELTQTSQPTAALADAKAPSGSFTKLRRKSWILSSRSPSPTKRAAEDGAKKDTAIGRNGWSLASMRRKPPATDDRDGATPRASLSRKSSEISKKGVPSEKKPKRPLSALIKGSGGADARSVTPTASAVPTLPYMPKSFSTERLPYLPRSAPSSERIPPVPRTLSSDKLKGIKPELRKKDELWSVFRTLDGDFQKFQSKSIALKANVVRSSLLPFLRSYATHPSNTKLRAEDLDRRANILNKWWTGLLEMLHGRNNQSISGTDRPVILDGISGIMDRQEWRLHPSPFCPLNERKLVNQSRSTSTTSLASSSSDFLIESVHHNIRNIFIQNLLAQMAFVIDKMSLRNAPASLVTFCGKTCAYAFFFCPGIADVLVRLWKPSVETMRRMLNEAGARRQPHLRDVSRMICSVFPPALQSLSFTSLNEVARDLRKSAPPPLSTANLQWDGPWVSRWAGRESDLFYAFFKHYHILVTDFLPPDATQLETACVPGLVIVHAQLLTNLDSTIHRLAAAAADEPTAGASLLTFDDVLSEPDAAASTLPIPPANATRLMAENRIIMLIRDCLSERGSGHAIARHLFAESFNNILQAAARKTSLYDHNACYTLCDFLDEAVVIMIRYEHISPTGPVLDWSFWLEVCRQMAASQNTTTQIRLYTFLYNTWAHITSDPRRKTDLCLNFLLGSETFESMFNHWCPMVRAYYMRLLLWRVARVDGEPAEADLDILDLLFRRLRSVWSHFIFLSDEAQATNGLLPSTAPCNPAPGRRLLIVRTDPALSPTSGTFLSFDGVISPGASGQGASLNRQSPIGQFPNTSSLRPTSAQSTDSSDWDEGEDTGKKRWGLLRNLLSTTKTQSKSQTPDALSRQSTKVSSASAASSASNTITSNQPGLDSPSTDSQKDAAQALPPHRAYCFKFSLEWVDRRFQTPGNMRLYPPRLPLASQQLLRPKLEFAAAHQPVKPTGAAVSSSKYAGRALAEWTMLVNECHNFFERRKSEGVPSNRLVETPMLGVEVFRRPG